MRGSKNNFVSYTMESVKQSEPKFFLQSCKPGVPNHCRSTHDQNQLSSPHHILYSMCDGAWGGGSYT